MTNRARASRCWMFTINNPSGQDDPQVWREHDDVTFCIYQLEKGLCGTKHYQGYVELDKRKTLPWCKAELNSRAHWGARKGTQAQAVDYCSKEDTRVLGPWQFGTKRQQGKRSDLDSLVEDIVDNELRLPDLVENHGAMIVRYPRGIQMLLATQMEPFAADDVRGIWYYGPPGTGKSRKAYDMWPDAYRKAQNKWFDGYAGEKTIVLDDLDLGGKCLGHYLKIWADRYPCKAEIKGGTLELEHERFVVTSNYQIQDLWGEDEQMVRAIQRRFRCVRFDGLPSVVDLTGSPGVPSVVVDPPISVDSAAATFNLWATPLPPPVGSGGFRTPEVRRQSTDVSEASSAPTVVLDTPPRVLKRKHE